PVAVFSRATTALSRCRARGPLCRWAWNPSHSQPAASTKVTRALAGGAVAAAAPAAGPAAVHVAVNTTAAARKAPNAFNDACLMVDPSVLAGPARAGPPPPGTGPGGRPPYYW